MGNGARTASSIVCLANQLKSIVACVDRSTLITESDLHKLMEGTSSATLDAGGSLTRTPSSSTLSIDIGTTTKLGVSSQRDFKIHC